MWDKITVGKYQELYEIITDQTFELEVDRDIHLLSALFGKPVEHYESMSLPDLKQEVKKTEFLHVDELPKVAVKRELLGGKYQVVFDFRKLAAGQFIDALSCAKTPEDHITNLHRMLAAICRPTKRTLLGRRQMAYGAVPYEQVAEDMKKVPVLEAQAVALFFYRVWLTFLESMPDFLKSQMEKMTPERRSQWIPVLQAVGDGFSAPPR